MSKRRTTQLKYFHSEIYFPKEVGMTRFMMQKVTVMLIVFLAVIASLTAQISNFYAFTGGTEPYVAVSGTPVPTAIGDNVISNPIDIGFPFVYGANSYSQIKISSNGYITLGTAPGSMAVNALGSATCPVIAPLWDDTYLQGSAQYHLGGTAPNRVFTVQFAGIKWPANSVTSFNYQVKLYEDRTIEFIYGPGVGMPVGASASIGINMLPGGYNNFCSVTPGNPASASFTVENANVNSWPGANTKYTFSAPNQHNNDLAAVSLSGNQTPTVGVSYDYVVSVFNAGINAQTSYSVSLMSGTTELATVVGPALSPLATALVTIPWVPGTAGATSIRGKVSFAGDENTANNETEAMSLMVQPEGMAAITIGDGSQLARRPIDVSYRNSMFETIFPASEIPINGTLTGLTFYSDFTETCPNVQTKIWLGTTTQSSLASGWIPAYQLVQVFDGSVNYLSGQNSVNITFNTATPFTYNGGNLVMLVNRPMSTSFYSVNNRFQCQTIGTNRSRMAFSDVTTYDPNNMGTIGSASGQFPKTTFYMQTGANEPAFSIDPQSHNFGQVIINNSASQSFTVYNSGGGVLNISSIEISGSPFFSVQNPPALPIALGSGQSTTFSVQYLPSQASAHSGSVNITDDLTRITHTVSLHGTCVDPTILSLPHTQNFDSVTSPNLPLGWRKLTTGTGTVTTVSTMSFTAPNSVMMNNSNSALGPFLIAPPISSQFPMNTLKVRFMAKGASAFSLTTGVMSDPQEANTFQDVQSITLTSDWAEYSVDLRTYSGNGTFIAFKHAQGGNNRSIYLDNVRIEALLQNDLAAVSISGNVIPNIGSISNYSIGVFNRGLNPQQNYQVSLYKQGGIELATMQGPPLSGNTSAVVTIPWEPTQIENTILYAKVILASDENPANDQTANLNVSVQASATTLVTVGLGDQVSSYMPMDMSENSSLFQNIYTQSEMLHAGLITIVEFYNSFTVDVLNAPTKIWLGMTTEDNLDAGWIPASQLNLVFDGNVNYNSGVNTISIGLQEPFTLASGYNLVMMVQRPYSSQTYGSWESFRSQNHSANRSRIAGASTEIDPNNPPNGSYVNSYPKTGFYITPGAAGRLDGIVKDNENMPVANAVVRIQNGPHTLSNENGAYSFPFILASDYAVTVSAHGFYDHTSYVTVATEGITLLDFSLESRQTVMVTGRITGSDTGEEGLGDATIILSGYEDYQAITDADGSFSISGVFAEQSYEYLVEAEGYVSRSGIVEVGESDTEIQGIILAEITYMPRNVSAIVVNNHTSVDLLWLAPDPEMAGRALTGYKIWRLQLGQETDETDWVSLTPNPITLLRFTDSAWPTLPQGTFKWAVKSVYTGDLISEAALSNGLRTTGKLTGYVHNLQDEPIQGAVVSAGSYSATSLADGSFTLHLPDGSYSVVCSKEGYYNVSQHEIEIVVGETTELNFSLTPVSTTGTLSGVVRNSEMQPIVGATIVVGTYQATTVADGGYFLNLPPGAYSVTCSHEDYFSQTQDNVQINLNQTTVLNFIIQPVANEDDVQVTATRLIGNYPNPFNPHTTISYDIKDPGTVSLSIFNVKGQLIRILVDAPQSAGRHTVMWDGKDSNGAIVGNGVYQYILKTPKHHEIKRMTLLK